MTPRTKKTAAALGGALVLASGAYAFGAQAGDGAALAGGTTSSARQTGSGPGHRGPGHDLSDAAARLGVSEAKLRAAFRSIHDRVGPRADAFAEDLARELGVKETDVRAALTKLREDKEGDRHAALAAALAQRLNLSEDKVREALDALPHHGRRGRP
jgi:hypothetical protein